MRTRTLLPRPEYPRPDRRRSFVHGVDWLNLNGPWEFRFDDGKAGLCQDWQLPGGKRWPEQILVPFCWESLAAWGEADAAGNDHFFARRVYRQPLEVTPENYRSMARYEVGWYRRTVQIPQTEPWQGKRVVLTIGAADFSADAWCNGHHLGHHEGGYLPFEFDLTDYLDKGTGGAVAAQIVIRVEDRMQNREQPVGKQWGWYSSVSGIWQTVFIEPRSREYIERFEITSDLQAATVKMRIFTHGGGAVHVNVTSPHGGSFEQTFITIDGRAEGVMRVAPVILWDPNDPQLYQVTFTLLGEELPDVVHGYFGIRSLSAAPPHGQSTARLVLNGRPIYVRGALYQSYYAEGVYTAGDAQTLQDDISLAKRAGFDMLRIHLKIDDPLLLYYADTIGILLMADFPNFGEGGDTPLGRRRFEEMMRGGIARDFNHPSVIAWCLFNETWGFGGQLEILKLINPTPPDVGLEKFTLLPDARLANQRAYAWVRDMWMLAKQLDPSRLVEDMSVVAWDHLQYYGHGETDVNSWHFYTDDYYEAREHIEEVIKKTYPGSTFNTAPGITQGGQPLINSEYGGVGALDGDVDISWSFKFLTNELRRHDKLSAYIFTELHDVEWERNGFLNYDRTPKDFGYSSTLINQGDVLPIDAPPIQRRSPGEEIVIGVYSSHFSRKHRENVVRHWRFSGGDSLGWMHDDLNSGARPIPFGQYSVELADEVKLRMPAETMLCTFWVRAVTPEGVLVASNYVQILVDAGLPHRQQGEDRLILRSSPSFWSAQEWSGASCTKQQAEETDSCFGNGHGYFEWKFPLEADDLTGCTRIRVLCEASSHREGTPQTDSFAHRSDFRMSLDDTVIYHCELPNHPHDTRGALSYLRRQKGAYGYLTHGVLEDDALREFLARRLETPLKVRCICPPLALAGGLTIYGESSGRYPIPPTVIIEY
jgi:hypothetical protein